MIQPSECACRVLRNPLCGTYPDGSGDCIEIESGPCHAISQEKYDGVVKAGLALCDRADIEYDATTYDCEHNVAPLKELADRLRALGVNDADN